MKKFGLFTIYVALMCTNISCKEKVTQEGLIQSALILKIQQWREAQLKTCEEKATVAAEAFVDSILVVNSLPTKLDTIPKDLKPMKPPKPYFKIKPDSVVVGDIKKDIQF